MKEKIRSSSIVRRLLSIIAAVVMTLGMVGGNAIPAMADTTHSITIENTNTRISINGKTYTAYKLFDSTHSGDAYAYTLSTSSPFYSDDLTTDLAAGTTPSSLSEVLRTYFTFTAPSNGSTILNVTPKGTFDANTARAFADAIQQYLSNVDKKIGSDTTYKKTAIASNETATIALDNDDDGLGYYIVTGSASSKADSSKTVESAVMVTNEDPTPAVNPKADIPTLDKKITGVKDGNTTKEGAVLTGDKAAMAGIGDVVSFELDSVVPNLTGYTSYTYEINDTLSSGLDFVMNDDSTQPAVSVSIDNTPLATNAYSVTWSSTDKGKIKVTIPYDTLRGKDGRTIVVTYAATVNDNAITTNYDNNTASLTYSNDPYKSDSTETTPDSKTYVINVRINVDKVAGNAQGNKLAGAKFKLYKGSDSSKNNVWYQYNNGKVTWGEEKNATELTTDENGALNEPFYGLGNGTYSLVETEAPKGYNKLLNPIPVSISATYGSGDNASQIIVSATGAVVSNGTVDITQTAKKSTDEGVDGSTLEPVATATVINNSGSVLPSTGGIGTTIFYIVGGVIVAGAIVLLIAHRRKNAR